MDLDEINIEYGDDWVNFQGFENKVDGQEARERIDEVISESLKEGLNAGYEIEEIEINQGDNLRWRRGDKVKINGFPDRHASVWMVAESIGEDIADNLLEDFNYDRGTEATLRCAIAKLNALEKTSESEKRQIASETTDKGEQELGKIRKAMSPEFNVFGEESSNRFGEVLEILDDKERSHEAEIIDNLGDKIQSMDYRGILEHCNSYHQETTTFKLKKAFETPKEAGVLRTRLLHDFDSLQNINLGINRIQSKTEMLDGQHSHRELKRYTLENWHKSLQKENTASLDDVIDENLEKEGYIESKDYNRFDIKESKIEIENFLRNNAREIMEESIRRDYQEVRENLDIFTQLREEMSPVEIGYKHLLNAGYGQIIGDKLGQALYEQSYETEQMLQRIDELASLSKEATKIAYEKGIYNENPSEDDYMKQVNKEIDLALS